MEPLPVLQTKRLLLRLALIDDAATILKFIIQNRSHFSPWEPLRNQQYYTLDYWKESIRKDQADFFNDESVSLYLFENSASQLIGSIHFSSFVRGPFQSCILGYKLDKNHEGGGFIFEALRTAIDFIFQELNFHRIEANYMPGNKRSANLLERLGFQIFGEEANYLQIMGRWERHIRTSLINKFWRDENHN